MLDTSSYFTELLFLLSFTIIDIVVGKSSSKWINVKVYKYVSTSKVINQCALFHVFQGQLSILSVVSFPNAQCTSGSDDFTFGTCLSATECGEAGGTKDGNCASGFGVCCVIK